ncbi:hypothetical protein BpHYR1_011346 [Brachionus plicatilis]|uniref:Uncharacterized protein n=1 Tax=Brachionus plicatilis TaxID=10195 RepID=A0A3M7SM56_BRAPC|nr:hypothetical protein BpHYR1_011346 [Brachionus plicatilis]
MMIYEQNEELKNWDFKIFLHAFYISNKTSKLAYICHGNIFIEEAFFIIMRKAFPVTFLSDDFDLTQRVLHRMILDILFKKHLQYKLILLNFISKSGKIIKGYSFPDALIRFFLYVFTFLPLINSYCRISRFITLASLGVLSLSF